MSIPLSSRSDIAPFHVMEVFEAAERRDPEGAMDAGALVNPNPTSPAWASRYV